MLVAYVYYKYDNKFAPIDKNSKNETEIIFERNILRREQTLKVILTIVDT